MLAIPMTLLFFVSEGIARIVDRRRRRGSFDDVDDDAASSIGGPSGLSEDED